MTSPLTPYSTAVPLFSASMKPTWVPDDLDVERIASYQLYEQLYWTVPDTLKLVARGYEDKPIYVPTGRTIVDTTNRYTAPGFKYRPTPRFDSPGVDTAPANQFFTDLFTREEFYTRFAGNKRYGLIRGDWCWHITADPTKPAGSRLSITSVDPGTYFPIPHPDNVDKIVGCHIVEQIKVGNDDRIRRLTYRKETNDAGVQTGRITVEEGVFKLDKWGGPEDRPEKVIRDVEQLHPLITALPVYHIKNFEEPQNPFGSSELRGFERIMAAINQAISDEELALALEGLGVYETDAPPPRNANNEEVSWVLGPGYVVEHPLGTKFTRVGGVGSVTPMQDHIGFLIKTLREASATPDIAVGVVDVTIAESGIARAIQLGPMLAKSDEKDQVLLGKHAQMGYDLINGWVPAYEQATFDGIDLVPTIGDKVPVDRTAQLAELDNMLDRGVIDAEFYRSEAAKLGYVFPDDMAARTKKEADAKAAAADPFAQRATTELTGASDG